MKKEYKILIAVFFAIVLIKIILSSFVVSPSIFNDEYQYMKLARAFFHENTFTIHGTDFQTYPPLYPMMISVAYLATDSSTIYWLMQCINAILSSLIIFPVFWLAREILSRKYAIVAACISVLLPSHFAMSPYILSENLFYPLAMLAFFFMYKSFTEKSLWWEVALGACLGLCLLTRVIGAILLGVVGLGVLYSLMQKNYEQIKRKVVAALTFLVVLLPWIIYKGSRFGYTPDGIFGSYTNVVAKAMPRSFLEVTFGFIDWALIYLAIIGVSIGVILFLLNWNDLQQRVKKNGLLYVLSIGSLILTILVVAKYAAFGSLKAESLSSLLTGRPIGRYAFFILPLLVITGLDGLKGKMTIFSNKKMLALFVVIGLSLLQIVSFRLYPVNNIPLSWIGAIQWLSSNHIITSIVTGIILLGAILISTKLIKNKKLIVKGTFLFCILISLLSMSMTIYNTQTKWDTNEQLQLGKWVNDNVEGSSVVFDEDFCLTERVEDTETSICHPRLHTTLAGTWINKPIRIGDVEESDEEIIITAKPLELEELTSTPSGIKVYRRGAL